jgi:hypothetical protein
MAKSKPTTGGQPAVCTIQTRLVPMNRAMYRFLRSRGMI